MIPRSGHDEPEPHGAKLAGGGGIVRRALRHGPGPEEELERVLAARRRELEDYAARFEETALELGRREQRLNDERAAVERLLRRSTTELEAREKELVQFERELDARHEHLQAAEAELARRRSDLGAVELKRAALDQRERALDARAAAIDERELQVDEARLAPKAEPGPTAAELCFVPGARYRLVEAKEPEGLVTGSVVEVEDEVYVVARVGPSPLPADSRRCAYLVAYRGGGATHTPA
jgi:hypothetical protein